MNSYGVPGVGGSLRLKPCGDPETDLLLWELRHHNDITTLTI